VRGPDRSKKTRSPICDSVRVKKKKKLGPENDEQRKNISFAQKKSGGNTPTQGREQLLGDVSGRGRDPHPEKQKGPTTRSPKCWGAKHASRKSSTGNQRGSGDVSHKGQSKKNHQTQGEPISGGGLDTIE